MNIFPRKNLNFHTAKVPGGLVFCPAGAITNAPDDVEDQALNPWFKALVDSGDIKVMSDTKGQTVFPGGAPGPTGQPLHSPDDETKKEADEEELGPPVSSEEAGKVQKPAAPATAPAQHSTTAQPVKK